jgi:hypothetical protein
MNRIGKIVLWVLVGFVLLAVGLLVLVWAKNLSTSQSASTAVSFDSGLAPELGIARGSTGMAYAGKGVSPQAATESVRSLSQNMMGATVGAADVNSPAPAPATPGTPERLIVKNGQLSVVVKSVNEALAAVADYTTKQGGFVVSSNVYKNGLVPYGTITVRVPAAKFDQGITTVKNLGELISESANGQDVTEEYVDLDAQLRNLRATEVQFMAIMSKAVKISDVLDVQRELTNVRGNIERLQGRMKYLKQSADLSTITVNFSTDPGVLPSYDNSLAWKPWAQVKEAARALMEAGKKLINVLIWFVIFLPIWLLIAGVAWLIVLLVKKIWRRYGQGINMLK